MNKPTVPFLFLVSLIAICMSSCEAYQYATFSSSLPQSQYDDFFFENDTLQVVYSFNGMDCPINIDIYNKLSKPLYINWKHSAIVLNGETISMEPNGQLFNTFSSVDSISEIYILNQSNIIPPQSLLSIDHLNLAHNFLSIAKADSSHRKKISAEGADPIFTKVHSFLKPNSPLYFKSYISLSDNSKDLDRFMLEHEFWVSDIYKTTSSSSSQSKSTYFVSKTTDFGNFMYTVTAATVLIGYIFLKVAEVSAQE